MRINFTLQCHSLPVLKFSNKYENKRPFMLDIDILLNFNVECNECHQQPM